MLAKVPNFKQRLEWFLEHRPDLAALVSRWNEPGIGERRLVALVRGHRMKALLKRMLDPNEFYSDHGVRSVSKYHEQHPFVMTLDGAEHGLKYEPAESRSGLFGGNSNWRGPVWMPMNYLLVEALQKFHHYYGDDFTVECPVGSGRIARSTRSPTSSRSGSSRSSRAAPTARRPSFGGQPTFQTRRPVARLLLFYEYFNGDNGAGLGASHQTGWTGLVAKLLQQQAAKQLARKAA
jgi:hypothetical protein